MRKMAIATAIMKLFTAQSGYRNRDGEIAHCARGLTTAITKLFTAQRGISSSEESIEVREDVLFKGISGYFSA